MMTSSVLSCSLLVFSLIFLSDVDASSDFIKDKDSVEEEGLENARPFGRLVVENGFTPRREEILQKMQEILGIRSQNENPSSRKVPPQFMTELYNTIVDSSGITRGRNPYNAKVVRSFTESDSSLSNRYFFNISGLEINESVLEAELHLYKKRTPLKDMHLLMFTSPYYLIRVYQILDDRNLDAPDFHRLLNVRYVDAHASGWQVFNVKQAVLGWMSGEPNLGLLVMASTIFEDDTDVDFSRRAKYHHSKQPILVLFDDDNSEDRSVDITPRYYAYGKDENEEQFNYEDDGKTEKINLEDTHKTKNFNRQEDQQGQLEEVQLANRHEPEFFQRQKRKYEDGSSSSNYRIRREQRNLTVETNRRRRDAAAYKKRLAAKIVSGDTKIIKILRSMDVYARAEFRERLGKTSSNRSMKQYRYGRSVNDHNDEITQQNVTECTRHELYVDFRDIGLSSSIIAPAGYSAYQCKGVCESPLSQDQHPTNHATVQAIVHKMDLVKDVGRPCCVPTKLLSTGILFYDDNENVVFKMHDEMVADHCGCR